MTRSDEVARAIHEECRGATKPVLVCFMGADEGVPGVAELRAARLPVYTFPESAANALAALETYRRWRDRPEGRIVQFEVDRAAAEAHMARATGAGREWLTGAEARGVLEAYGIAQATAVVVTAEADLPAAVAMTGLPAVLKRDSGGEHKSEADGLRLNLKTVEAVQRAFRELRGGPDQPLVLMEMVTGARELILGMSVDPVSGPLLMVGAGGTYVEIFQDVAFRIHPVTDDEAAEMLRSLKSYPLLTGFRGESAIDIAGVEEVVLRLSQLIGDFPRIIELDLNPFMALPAAKKPGTRGSRGVDARVRLSPADA
jgi:acetyltransferase